MKRIAAVVVLLVLAVLALAAPDADAHPLPEAWGVAEVRVGDSGVYERSVVRLVDGELVTVERPWEREWFQVEDASIPYDAEGRARSGPDFQTWRRPAPQGEVVQERLFLSASGEVLHRTVRTAGEGETNWGGGRYAWALDETSFGPGMPPMCGYVNALQGSRLALNTTHAFFPQDCRRAYYAMDGGGLWQAVRTDPFGDKTAVAFRQVEAVVPVMAWFVPDVPYPVRFLEQVTAGPQPVFAVLDLVAFTRGGEAPSSFTPRDLPAMRLVPLAPWGPDGGEDHPFPLQRAIEVAKADRRVADWLAERPGAYLRASLPNEGHTERRDTTSTRSEEEHSWHMILDDGRDALKVHVSRRDSEDHVSLLGTRMLPERRVTEAVRSVEQTESHGLAAARLPATMPDPAVVAAWWMRLAGQEYQEAWAATGNDYWCKGCPMARGALLHGTFVGHVDVESGLLGGDSVRTSWRASYLTVESNGAMSVVVENQNDAWIGTPASSPGPLERFVVPLLELIEDLLSDPPPLPEVPKAEEFLAIEPPPAAPAPSPSEAPPAPPAAALAVELPPVAVAAGIAAGVFAGGWLLRLILLALFSRVRRDRVLDHPLRQAILDLVDAEPGIHLRELMRRTGRGAGTVRHHLGKLKEAGLVREERKGGYVCYRTAPGGTGPPQGGARQVLHAVRDGHSSVQEIGGATSLARPTVDYHLRRLVEAGLVRQRVVEGRREFLARVP